MIAGSTVLLVALAGCAGTDAGQPSEAAPAEESAEESDAPASDEENFNAPDGAKPSGESGIPEKQVDASALPKGYPRKVVLHEAGDKLTITAQESGCGKASAEVVKQSSSQVVVLLVHTVPKEEKMCTMDIRYPQLRVELDKPLGDRTLVLKAEERKA